MKNQDIHPCKILSPSFLPMAHKKGNIVVPLDKPPTNNADIPKKRMKSQIYKFSFSTLPTFHLLQPNVPGKTLHIELVVTDRLNSFLITNSFEFFVYNIYQFKIMYSLLLPKREKQKKMWLKKQTFQVSFRNEISAFEFLFQ